MRRKKIILTITLVSVTLFMIFTGVSFVRATQPRSLPVYGEVQSFRLIDTSGKSFSETELENKVWIVDFMFTTCGTICPVMTKNMASLHRSYKLVDNVRFLSISVNPEQDSPEVLGEFASRYAADTTKWHFLTGPREAISDLAVSSFKIGHKDEPIFHSGKFVLVDPERRIRGYYDGTDMEEIQQLFKDIALLVKEN